jgi:hypothetical protein
MEPTRLVVLTTVRNRLQAEVITSELARRGIDAAFEEIKGPRERGSHPSIVKVAEPQLEQAREVVAGLTGRGAPAAMLDLRRLIPAILILVALIAVISWIVDLFV